MPPSSATIVVSGCSSFHSSQVEITTEIISSSYPSSWRGPERALPRNVSNIEKVWKSNITLLDRDSSPEVRSSMVSKPGGTSSVKYA